MQCLAELEQSTGGTNHTLIGGANSMFWTIIEVKSTWGYQCCGDIFGTFHSYFMEKVTHIFALSEEESICCGNDFNAKKEVKWPEILERKLSTQFDNFGDESSVILCEN